MDLKKKTKKNLKPKREINKYRMQEEEEDRLLAWSRAVWVGGHETG